MTILPYLKNQWPITSLIGSSGCGKTTLCKKICALDPVYQRSVSHTDRHPRNMEQEAVDYYYITKEEFLRKIKNHEFLEHNPDYATHHYGTSKREISCISRKGRTPILDIDYRGAEQLFHFYSGTEVPLYQVAILSPVELLRKRLLDRGDLTIEQIDTRLKRYVEEELPFIEAHTGAADIFKKVYENNGITILDLLANQIYNDAKAYKF